MNRPIAVALALLCGGVAAGAQEPPRVIATEAFAWASPQPEQGIEMKIGMLAAEPFDLGQPIDGAPYSADVVTEVVQDLADGNRIERRTTGRVARDSRGRVRREHELAAIGPVLLDDAKMVTIGDPEAGVHYTLDPTRKTAMVSRRARAVRMLAEGRGMVAFSKRLEPGPPPDAGETTRSEEQYEGLRAEVTRVVTTIHAGAIGNLRPIEVVSERWYSPELRVVVFSRRTDPRFGETVYKLTNIIRAEPDGSLFQVPADYRREEMKPPPPPPPPPPGD